MTLESVVGNDSFDFIKQDVQGSEILIIQGSVKIFQKADYILNEVNLDKIENIYNTILKEYENRTKKK